MTPPKYGYRLWRYFNWSPYYLRSLHKSVTTWIPHRAAKAFCLETNACPSMDSTVERQIFHKDTAFPCGIYAYKEDQGYPTDALMNATTGIFVGGWVAMWGNVEEHESGFVSQYAYPIKFTSVYSVNTTVGAELTDKIRIYLNPGIGTVSAVNLDMLDPANVGLDRLESVSLLDFVHTLYVGKNPDLVDDRTYQIIMDTMKRHLA